MISRHFALNSELTGAIAKRLPHAKNQPSAPGSFFNQFVTDIYIYIYIYIYKRASLACAARLADTACPQIYPVGAWEYTSLSCFILSTLDCHLSTVTLMKSEL